MKKKMIVFSILILMISYVFIGFHLELEINTYTISSSKLPKSFDDFCIVQLSDLHCKLFGKEQSELVEAIKKCEPDIIAITGDFLDRDHNSIENVEMLYRKIYDICPIYVVNGNHERVNGNLFYEQKNLFFELGIDDINNSRILIEKNGEKIVLAGIDQANTYEMNKGEYNNDDKEYYSILLYHNAALFDTTSKLGYDLVLSGHTHGGVIRLPIIGGLINNHRELFAEYEAGLYEKNGSILISNRGLGDTRIPRFYNNPEVVKIILKTQ